MSDEPKESAAKRWLFRAAKDVLLTASIALAVGVVYLVLLRSLMRSLPIQGWPN